MSPIASARARSCAPAHQEHPPLSGTACFCGSRLPHDSLQQLSGVLVAACRQLGMLLLHLLNTCCRCLQSWPPCALFQFILSSACYDQHAARHDRLPMLLTRLSCDGPKPKNTDSEKGSALCSAHRTGIVSVLLAKDTLCMSGFALHRGREPQVLAMRRSSCQGRREI
jgi:hypothetical protein